MKRTTLFFMLYCSMLISYAQVGIGTIQPDNSSILDIESANKGMLIPRMTNEQKNKITNPASGLMVYDMSNKCTSVNIGSPEDPNWECLNTTVNPTVPVSVVSNQQLYMSRNTNYRGWVNVPGLEATFDLSEDERIQIDWTLFVGNAANSATNQDGFAQLFTIIEINNVNDEKSCNYLPMVHNPAKVNTYYWALMNNSSFTYVKQFTKGEYTVRVKVFLADLLGSTNSVNVGLNIPNWSGGANMTEGENRNAASNKLTINLL